MKAKEMHAKTTKQLDQHAEKLAKKIADIQLSMITKNDTNVRQVRALKRERARALTIASAKHDQPESEEK